jgi:hypothetical protein
MFTIQVSQNITIIMARKHEPNILFGVVNITSFNVLNKFVFFRIIAAIYFASVHLHGMVICSRYFCLVSK